MKSKKEKQEFKTTSSVKKAINRMDIGSEKKPDNEYDVIAARIKKIDAFYAENADIIPPKVILKLHNSLKNVLPDFRALILSLVSSLLVLFIPLLIEDDSLIEAANSPFLVEIILKFISYILGIIAIISFIVFMMWFVAKNINSSKDHIVDDHHKEVLEKIINDDLSERLAEYDEKESASSVK